VSRRVVVTGLGSISALGRNTCEFWESLKAGRSGIAPIEAPDCTELRFRNGAEVRGYSHAPYFEDRRADFLDRFAQFAVIAAREAVADSGIEWTPELREDTAVVTGSCVGGHRAGCQPASLAARRGSPSGA
jgi:nodulation protein E